ncbi:MAG: hypothetical protein ACPGVP_00340 [Thiolinea sp.]
MKVLLRLLLTCLATFGFVYLFTASAAEKPQVKSQTALSVKDTGSFQLPVHNNLTLQVNTPDSLDIPDRRIVWTITQNSRLYQKITGNGHRLNLPAGAYQVNLKIGRYTGSRDIVVRQGASIQPYFGVNLAKIRLRSNQTMDWKFTGLNSNNFVISQRMQLDEFVPADTYVIKAVLRNMPLQKKVRLQPGQQTQVEMNIPVGKVRLIATKDDRPLFSPMSWQVYRLEKNRRQQVGQYHLHAQSISMPPGHYEAVARFRGTVRKRQFWVQRNTNNKIILGMD